MMRVCVGANFYLAFLADLSAADHESGDCPTVIYRLLERSNRTAARLALRRPLAFAAEKTLVRPPNRRTEYNFEAALWSDQQCFVESAVGPTVSDPPSFP
jgi:hypothetical protein